MIGEARSVYNPVAKRGSILYFAEAGLSMISSMYEISLDSFLNVFKSALSSAKKDPALENRLRNMIETVMRQIYDYTCTGIFEKHKLMFSFQMTCMIMTGDGTLDSTILDFFLKGDTSLDGVSEECPASWLSGSGWKDLLCLAEKNDVCAELLKDFVAEPAAWKDWYDLESPEMAAMPLSYSTRLTPLCSLGVMRCFRPDRVYNAVKLFVMNSLGEKFVQPPVLDYARIFAQSTPGVPMVFLPNSLFFSCPALSSLTSAIRRCLSSAPALIPSPISRSSATKWVCHLASSLWHWDRDRGRSPSSCWR